MFAGHVIAHPATTVIVNEHVGPAVVEQFTVVVPTGNDEPLAGVHVTVPQPGVEVGAGYETVAEPLPGELSPTVMFAGHVIAHVAVTVTVNEHDGPAVVEQFTVVVPTGNDEPEAGVHVTVPHDPVVVGAA